MAAAHRPAGGCSRPAAAAFAGELLTEAGGVVADGGVGRIGVGAGWLGRLAHCGPVDDLAGPVR
jgi:hypothetical protein